MLKVLLVSLKKRLLTSHYSRFLLKHRYLLLDFKMFRVSSLQSILFITTITTDQITFVMSEFCLTEECVMASATILGSLDKSVSPCDNFYQFACGGLSRQVLFAPTDRFEAVEKLNQNVVLQVLERNVYESSTPTSAFEKAQAFYQSCVTNMDKYENLNDLLAIIQYAGGWNVLGDDNYASMNNKDEFGKRMQILQNKLAVNAFFTRRLIRHNGRKRLAIVAGGWNKGFAEMTSQSHVDSVNNNVNFKPHYLQMMDGIVMDLWQVNFLQKQKYQNFIGDAPSNGNDYDTDSANATANEIIISDYNIPNHAANNVSADIGDSYQSYFTSSEETQTGVGVLLVRFFDWSTSWIRTFFSFVARYLHPKRCVKSAFLI